MIDQQAVVAAYAADTSLNISELAQQFGITPSQASAILHLAGVKPRRGNPNGPPPDALARGLVTRRAKALTRAITDLVDRYGFEAVDVALHERKVDGQPD